MFQIYLFLQRERERKHEHEREGKKERERESQAYSVLSAEPHVALDLMTLRSQPEPKSREGRLTDWVTKALLMHPIFFFF